MLLGQWQTIPHIPFKSMLEDSNMPHIRFHDLMHSAASFLSNKALALKKYLFGLDIPIYKLQPIYTHMDKEQKETWLKCLMRALR